MAKLTKEKVKAMMTPDIIWVPCNNAREVDSAYQTAVQAKEEMGERGKAVAVSKSNVTLTVVVRTGL